MQARRAADRNVLQPVGAVRIYLSLLPIKRPTRYSVAMVTASPIAGRVRASLRARALASLLSLAGIMAAHAGDIYRCVGADGAVSYTNIACPADSEAQHVASYEPEPNAPPAPYAPVSDSAEVEARIARETEQAREFGYRQAQAELAQAAAQNEQAQYDSGPYVPVYLPAYPVGVAYGAGRGHSDHHRHRESHDGGAAPHPPRSPNALPLSSIPFYRPH